jgi:hypothetical protein
LEIIAGYKPRTVEKVPGSKFTDALEAIRQD